MLRLEICNSHHFVAHNILRLSVSRNKKALQDAVDMFHTMILEILKGDCDAILAETMSAERWADEIRAINAEGEWRHGNGWLAVDDTPDEHHHKWLEEAVGRAVRIVQWVY